MNLASSMLANAKRLAGAGKAAEAIAVLGQVLRVPPVNPEALEMIQALSRGGGEAERAIAALDGAAKANPKSAELSLALARVALDAGKLAEAEAAAEEAARRAPSNPAAWMQRGRVLQAIGGARLEEAFASMRRATELAPGDAMVWFNFGTQLMLEKRFAEAEAALRRAHELEPRGPMILARLGRAVLEQERTQEALGLIRGAVELSPRSSEVVGRLGMALVGAGQAREGCEVLQRSLTLDPENRNAREALVMGLNYVSQDGEQLCAEHRAFGQRIEAAVAPLPPLRAEGPDRPLRVGLMSSDFRTHSCAHFMLPLMEKAGSCGVEVWCVSASPRDDAMTERFKAIAAGWLAVAGRGHGAAAEAIRGAGIDVLIECNGLTSGNRLEICAARPCPVQMTFLGYPCTTGLSRIDHRLVDDITDPAPAADAFSVEGLLRVPRCLWCFRPSDDAPPVSEAPVKRKGHATIGCFNNISKITPEAVRAWAEILRRAPGTTLLLKNRCLHEPQTLAWFRAQFDALGVDGSRIESVPYTKTIADHLKVYEQIDFQLDTFPYNGTTTTCESFWQGVPVVAVEGRVHAARVSMSLLRAVGLDELVAPDVEGYVRRAVELAQDPERIASMRASMRDRMNAGPLRDETGYRERFWGVVREGWRAACARA